MHPHPGATSSIDYADRLHAILESKNLTLHQVSQQSEVQHGHSSPYFLPHNLYYDLRTGKFSPSIYQMSFLSRVSNYLLNDWLRAFGFNVEDISRMQVILPSKRTVLLNSSLMILKPGCRGLKTNFGINRSHQLHPWWNSSNSPTANASVQF